MSRERNFSYSFSPWHSFLFLSLSLFHVFTHWFESDNQKAYKKGFNASLRWWLRQTDVHMNNGIRLMWRFTWPFTFRSESSALFPLALNVMFNDSMYILLVCHCQNRAKWCHTSYSSILSVLSWPKSVWETPSAHTSGQKFGDGNIYCFGK